MLHRRWAKIYIQKWREENLNNATTTTSDNGTDEEMSFEKAGVPEAYRKWLDWKLPRWHRKWGGQKMKGQASKMGEESDQVTEKDGQAFKFKVGTIFILF